MSIQGTQDINNVTINIGRPISKDIGLVNYDAFDNLDESGLYNYQQGGNFYPPNNSVTNLTGTVPAEVITVADQIYDSTLWNNNLSVPTKNAIRDKIESLTLTGNTVINNGSGFSGYIDASQPKYAFQQGTDVSSGFQVAINDAIAGYKTLRLPPGTYNLSIPIRILQSSSGNNLLNIEGDTTVFNWTGASTGVVIESSNSYYYHYKNISLNNSSAGGRGSLTGMLLTGPGFAGTQNVGGIHEHLIFNNFHYGIMAGGPLTGKAASEQLYISCQFSNNNIGWSSLDFNTLDHTFVMLLMTHNLTGLDPRFCNVQVLGGSATANQVDFNFSSHAPQSIIGFRTELSSGFANIEKGNVNIKGCQIYADTTGINAITITNFGQVTLENNYIRGKISYNPFYNSFLRMYNNHITDNGASLPFIVNASNTLYATYDVCDNQKVLNDDINTMGFMFDDGAGSYQYTAQIKDYSREGYDRFYSNSLSQKYARITSFGQGTGMGNNLRLQAKFNGTGTCNVLFQKSGNINISTNNKIINLTGNWLPLLSGDIGKRIYIPTGAFSSDLNLAQQLYITKVNSSGQLEANIWPSNTTNNIACIIGQNEPDANYFISATPNTGEIISWSNKTITGFTLTSNNISSNALVDVMVIR